MDLTQTIILSQRLMLVPISLEFTQDIFENFTPEITTYMFPCANETLEETKAFILSVMPLMKKNEELVTVILNRDTDEFLGVGGIHRIHTSTPELGIWIKKNAHGSKFGREAVSALKKWADEHVDYKYLVYPVDKRNISSRKIAESLGGKVEKEYIKENMSGNILQEVEYRIYK